MCGPRKPSAVVGDVDVSGARRVTRESRRIPSTMSNSETNTVHEVDDLPMRVHALKDAVGWREAASILDLSLDATRALASGTLGTHRATRVAARVALDAYDARQTAAPRRQPSIPPQASEAVHP